MPDLTPKVEGKRLRRESDRALRDLIRRWQAEQGNALDMIGQVLDACDECDRLRQQLAERDAEIVRLKAECATWQAEDAKHAEAANLYYGMFCDAQRRRMEGR